MTPKTLRDGLFAHRMLEGGPVGGPRWAASRGVVPLQFPAMVVGNDVARPSADRAAKPDRIGAPTTTRGGLEGRTHFQPS